MSLIKKQAYINGEWVDATSKATFEVKNPVNGGTVGAVPNMDGTDTEKAIRAANEAFKTWGNTTGKERSLYLQKWQNLIKANVEELLKILISETGKPSAEAVVEPHGAIRDIEFFSEEAKRIRGEIIPSSIPDKKMYVEKQPLGVVGLITPWNFPLGLSVKKMATALAAGCTCVLKPAEDTPLAVLAVVELAHQAGFPKGVINVITCDRPNASAVGGALCSSPLVAGISFTGSTAVGKILYGQCAPHIKRIALELGGNSPFLVFNSASIDKAVQYGIRSKFFNCGQICIASNRFLVQENIHDEFVKKFSEAMKNIKAGVTMGPLINATQFQRVCSMVDDAKSKGANILVGGKPASKSGELFYEPSLITGVRKDMQIFQDEIFGPVASVMKFKTEDEGVALANDTEKGLAAYFFTEDVGQIFRIGKLLQAGIVGINDALTISESCPFGGIKQSGIGKEGSHYGIDEYCYMKYLCIGL